MKILVAIPFLCGGLSSKETLDSIKGTDVFALNNGADKEVVDVLDQYQFHKRVDLPDNIYVNPAWNIFIKYFLDSYYDRLIIMNNDLTMGEGWKEVCEKHWETNPHDVVLPDLTEDKELRSGKVDGGTPGVFITMNRKQAGMVYPIPDYVKVWFGDEWIFKILRSKYDTIILHGLKAKHYGSTSIKTPDIHYQISVDKIRWKQWGDKDIQERIKKLA